MFLQAIVISGYISDQNLCGASSCKQWVCSYPLSYRADITRIFEGICRSYIEPFVLL